MSNKLNGKTTIAKRRTAYVLLGIIALFVLFLCIEVLRNFVYGVFGYAIYAYLPALLVSAILLLIGKKPNVSLGRAILYISLFFMIVTTLHIGLSKTIIEGDAYLYNNYKSASTVGGVVIALLAGLFRFICAGNYGIMLAVTFVISAVLGLVALYPLILEMGKSGKKKKSQPRVEETSEFSRNLSNANNLVEEADPLFAQERQEDYGDVVNVSGARGELFAQLTNDADRYRMRADQSADLLFGSGNSSVKNKKVETAPTQRYSTLNTLGTESGYRDFISNQERMRKVEENLKPLSPQEEYIARFGGGLNDGYAQSKSFDNFDPMNQFGGSSAYEPTKESGINYFAGNGADFFSQSYQQPQAREEVAEPDYSQKEPTQPKQTMFADRASALDFINTPLSAEELVNLDFGRPNRSEVIDNAYMYDDSYGTKKQDAIEPVSVEYVSPASTEKREESYVERNHFEEVKPIEKVVEQPVVPVKKEPEIEMVQPKPIQRVPVQEKFNLPPKPQKPVYSSNVMAKEQAPVLPEQKETPKKPYVPKPYKVPGYDVLRTYEESNSDFPEDYEIVKGKINQTMQEFDVPAEVFDAKKGPTFTMYYLKVGQGYKLSKIPSFKDNLKMRLCVKNLRIHAPIEGQDALGIELPNSKRDTIGLKSILCSDAFNKDNKGLKIAMGKTLEGAPYVADITKMPHMLVAGSTGTGKSVFLNSVLTSLLFKYSPEDLRLVLIDPKKVELTVYRNLPNLLIKEPVKEAKHAVNALRWLCDEMDRRYSFFEKVGCSNIQQYNELYKKPEDPKMYRILLVIDEMADLMINSRDSSVEDYIVRIAQLARACGIHMIIATQRPTVKVITGLIKSNIIHRVAFTVKTNMDSRVILDDGGAEELLGMGDMLYSTSDGLIRMQGAYVDIAEIKTVCDYIRENNESEYDESIAKAVSYEPPKPETAEERSAAREEVRDAEFEKQLQIILKTFIKTGKASVSSAQSAHRVGYIKAKKLVDAMTERGFVGPEDGAKPREVLITMDEWEQLFGANAQPTVPVEDEYDEE